MLAVGGEMVIQAGDERVVIQAHWCAEPETGVIETIAHRVVIGGVLAGAECLIEVASVVGVEDSRINPDMQRIEALDVGGRKRRHSAVYVLVSKNALAKRRSRDVAHYALLLAFARSLVIGEEEQPVLLDRTTQRSSEDVADQLERLVGLAARQLRLFDEVVVGAGRGVAQIFVS